MTISKREKLLALGVGGVVGLFLLNMFAIDPYFESRAKLAKDLNNAKVERQTAISTQEREVRLQRVWKQMTDGGLRTDIDAASAKIQADLRKWMDESGMALSNIGEQRRTADPKFPQFVQVGVRCGGRGPMRTVAQLLWRIEKAGTPMRITELELKPVNEGKDMVMLSMTISTLAYDPERDKTEKGRTERADRARPNGAVADAGGR